MINTEINREISPEVAKRYISKATPLFTTHGCVLLERMTEKAYIYKAENLETSKSIQISRRMKPMPESDYAAIAAKIIGSEIAGPGKYMVDMPPSKNLSREHLAEVLKHIFAEVLPEHGYNIRDKQIELSEYILEALARRNISIAEAEVGIGKTNAYIIAATLAKRGRVNDFWFRGSYPDQSYADSASMPVVISTSSIALQKAVAREYIPPISCILMECGVIETPLTCAIRKGKEHFICEKKLHEYLYFEQDATQKKWLELVIKKRGVVDLANIAGLSAYAKRKIAVPGHCGESCRYHAKCRYIWHMERAKNRGYDFQVCNHNYLLADAIRRSNEEKPLIPHYQGIIIDEAHKLLSAARQMYGAELNSATILQLRENLCDFEFRNNESPTELRRLAVKLTRQSGRLFKFLKKGIAAPSRDEEAERFAVELSDEALQNLRNISEIIKQIENWLKPKQDKAKAVKPKFENKLAQVMHDMSNVREQATMLAHQSELICWVEHQELDDVNLLCAIPKRLSRILFEDIWCKGVPVVFTSGTLSTGSSFEYFKRGIGLDKMSPARIMETRKPSPFNHEDNVLMYISENVPFPNGQSKAYLEAVADEIERLVRATHGHAAILFTSYIVMSFVHAQLKKRELPFPFFCMRKADTGCIEQFRQSGNGVLFATGAMWEGIDLPGDILSLLVIVKLPFAVPDPVSDYEQSQYANIDEYKKAVVVPEMLVKLRQGFGRLIRSETDSGVVAILDSRVQPDGAYRHDVLNALPSCPITSDISDVKEYIQKKKSSPYFECGGDF